MYVSRAAAVNSAQYQTVLLLYNPTVFMLTLSRLLKTKSSKYRQVSLQVNTRGHVTLPQSDQHLANSTLFRKLYVSMIKRGNCTFIKVRSNTVSQDSWRQQWASERACRLGNLCTVNSYVSSSICLEAQSYYVTGFSWPIPLLSLGFYSRDVSEDFRLPNLRIGRECNSATATKDIH